MRYWDELLRLERHGIELIVDKSWEDLSPRDCFDDSVHDLDKICADIDRGDLDWFMLRCRALFQGHELGNAIVGGFLYEDARDVLKDGTALDLMYQAEQEARAAIPKLIEGLSKIEVDKLAA